MEPFDDSQALREEIARLRKALAEATADLNAMLRTRGFRVHSKEPEDDLLVPAPGHMDGYYEAMNKYSFRLFLRDVIKYQEGFSDKDVTRYATADVTADYIAYLLDIGLIEKMRTRYRVIKRPVKSFGPTLEWFVAEMFKRELHAQALWGVKFKGQRTGGDYDLVAKVDGVLLYMEVKSSPPKQVYESEIAGFMDRVLDLNPGISVFFMDTELRMKDKIVPMFEEELRRRLDRPPPVSRMQMELFHVSHRIFIINAKHTIKGNIEKALSHYFRHKDRGEI